MGTEVLRGREINEQADGWKEEVTRDNDFIDL